MTAKEVLELVNQEVGTLSPLDASVYLQELIHELAYYSLGLTKGIIAPVIKGHKADLLLVAPQEKLAIIVPDNRIVT
jgi:hypothetical protein